MGFTKLDSGILQSSIMAEKPDIFKVWITLLAACGWDGVARVSSVYLSSICHLPQITVDKAITQLESPDPHSRSLNDEGRRIKRIDGGWYVINYKKYRDFTYSDSPEAVRQRRFREKRDRALHVTTRRDISVSVSASVSSSEFKNLWKEWPVIGRQKKKYCEMKFNALVKAGKLDEFKKVTQGYFIFLAWQKNENNFEQRVMNLSTWLNNWEGEKERYVDENGNVRKPEPRL